MLSLYLFTACLDLVNIKIKFRSLYFSPIPQIWKFSFPFSDFALWNSARNERLRGPISLRFRLQTPRQIGSDGWFQIHLHRRKIVNASSLLLQFLQGSSSDATTMTTSSFNFDMFRNFGAPVKSSSSSFCFFGYVLINFF